MNLAAPPRLAFVHIPKTAGTSVRQKLARLYGERALPAMTTLDYPLYSDARLADYRFYSGHAYRRDYMRLPADTVLMTVFREPVARAISLYGYFRSITVPRDSGPTWEATEIARTCGLVEFVRSEHPVIIEHLRSGQLRQFLASAVLNEIVHRPAISAELERRVWDDFVRNLDAFRYVFTVDWLDMSLAAMLRELDLPDDGTSLPRANASPREFEIDEMAVRRAVYEISPLDCRAYDLARERERRFLKSRFALAAPAAAE